MSGPSYDADGEAVGWSVRSDGMLCDISCPYCGTTNKIVIPWAELCAHVNGHAVEGAQVNEHGVLYNDLCCRPCGPAARLPLLVDWKDIKDAIFRGRRGGFVTGGAAG